MDKIELISAYKLMNMDFSKEIAEEKDREEKENKMNTVKKEKKMKDRPVKKRPWKKTVIMSLTMAVLIMTMAVPVFAAEGGDPIAVVNNLSEFIFGLIRAVGIILLGWGIVQVGLSFQSHDPSQRSNGFLTLAGGLVITFAKEILNLIIG